MARLLGLETEYGVHVDDVDLCDLVDAARECVKCYAGTYAAPWDYRDEDPLRDGRGFRARALATNPEDDRCERPARPPLSRADDHADRVLTNGARLYQDHGHPEYSTPECLSLRDLVAQDKAGERIVWACAQAYGQQRGVPVKLFKNNTDYHGMSYGCHENYLVKREVSLNQLISALIPFLVTRILFTGAGKVGAERPERLAADQLVPYQLSQRADFVTEIASVDTLHRRPLFNTRDEPHADPARWRRLHMIAGEANLCEYATALKTGTMELVLSLIELGWQAPLQLKDPVASLQRLSLAPPGRWDVALSDGRTIDALDVQRLYLTAAERQHRGRDDDTNWILAEWSRVLHDLGSDPRRLRDRLDWVAKLDLLESFLRTEGLGWDADLDLLRSLDLAYHSLDPEQGLFCTLEQQGAVRQLVQPEDVRRAMAQPPPDTRAYIRGWCVRQFGPAVREINWSRIQVSDRTGAADIDLQSLVGQGVVELNGQLRLLGELSAPDLQRWLQRHSVTMV